LYNNLPTVEKRRAAILRNFGADAEQAAELLAYNTNCFRATDPVTRFPLEDEPFVKVWEEYVREVRERGSITALAIYLVELSFPIEEGMSRTGEYIGATRRGIHPAGMSKATGLQLEAPEQCQVLLHRTAAGRIPLILPATRKDFLALVQAFTGRNEPMRQPSSMGACIVSGYNNWNRIDRLHQEFRCLGGSKQQWLAEFERIKPKKHLYQDRFIILSNGPYSGIAGHEVGYSEQQWQEISLVIRREHECAHYFTKRVFASMQKNVMDEIIADYSGITAAAGKFQAGWLLRFFGLESFPVYRQGGRLENYRGNPPLSDAVFCVLQKLVHSAIYNLERFSEGAKARTGGPLPQWAVMMSLASLTLEDLAGESGAELLFERFSLATNTAAQRDTGTAGSSAHVSVAPPAQELRTVAPANS
jgi:hypothetical protein